MKRMYEYIEKHCLNCGEIIPHRGRPSELPKKKYCSRECYYEYRRKYPEVNPSYTGALKKKICKGCGKEFGYYEGAISRKSDGKKSTASFCSLECRIKNGKKSRQSIGIVMRRRFGDKCMICGWEEATCDAHHIIPVKLGGKNKIENMVVLCPNHHRLANLDIITQEKLFEVRSKFSFPDVAPKNNSSLGIATKNLEKYPF